MLALRARQRTFFISTLANFHPPNEQPGFRIEEGVNEVALDFQVLFKLSRTLMGPGLGSP